MRGESSSRARRVRSIGVARGEQRGRAPKIFRKYSIFVLWEAFSKQNSVIRLKSNILPLPNFWAGFATVRRGPRLKEHLSVCC